MTFNFKLLLRLVYRALFYARGTNARLTPHRLLVIFIIFPLYVIIEAASWLGFLLDEVLFPGYRRQEIQKPLFIIGVPRSGTTFLQRLLAQDESQLTSMRLWEIIFAPSVTQKKFFAAIGTVDRQLGGYLHSAVGGIEKRILGGTATIHKMGLFEAEEDCMILLHIFSSAFLVFMFPFLDDLWPYVNFDMEMPPADRERIMRFYRRCVQRHLYAFGGGRRFLSKNPTFSGMVESLNRTFSDAQFVCMVRTPLDTVPSVVSLFHYYFNKFLSPVEEYPLRDAATRMVAIYYRYPLQMLALLPVGRQQVITYHALTSDPGATVSALYERFGTDLCPAYRTVLDRETAKARSYKSNHVYSLEQFNLSREQLASEFNDIFEQFGFERGV